MCTVFHFNVLPVFCSCTGEYFHVLVQPLLCSSNVSDRGRGGVENTVPNYIDTDFFFLLLISPAVAVRLLTH